MSYADVAASTANAFSLPQNIFAGTNFNFNSAGASGGDLSGKQEADPNAPAVATTSKATNGNAAAAVDLGGGGHVAGITDFLNSLSTGQEIAIAAGIGLAVLAVVFLTVEVIHHTSK